WAQWRVASPQSVPGFSAVGYFFGLEIQKARKVPVGIIHTSWGGTPAEAWTSIEFLEKTPELVHYVDGIKKQVASYEANKEQMVKSYQEQYEKYKDAVAKAKEENKKAPQAPRQPQHPDQNPNSPARLYNAM